MTAFSQAVEDTEHELQQLRRKLKPFAALRRCPLDPTYLRQHRLFATTRPTRSSSGIGETKRGPTDSGSIVGPTLLREAANDSRRTCVRCWKSCSSSSMLAKTHRRSQSPGHARKVESCMSLGGFCTLRYVAACQSSCRPENCHVICTGSWELWIITTMMCYVRG